MLGMGQSGRDGGRCGGQDTAEPGWWFAIGRSHHGPEPGGSDRMRRGEAGQAALLLGLAACAFEVAPVALPAVDLGGGVDGPASDGGATRD